MPELDQSLPDWHKELIANHVWQRVINRLYQLQELIDSPFDLPACDGIGIRVHRKTHGKEYVPDLLLEYVLDHSDPIFNGKTWLEAIDTAIRDLAESVSSPYITNGQSRLAGGGRPLPEVVARLSERWYEFITRFADVCAWYHLHRKDLWTDRALPRQDYDQKLKAVVRLLNSEILAHVRSLSQHVNRVPAPWPLPGEYTVALVQNPEENDVFDIFVSDGKQRKKSRKRMTYDTHAVWAITAILTRYPEPVPYDELFSIPPPGDFAPREKSGSAVTVQHLTEDYPGVFVKCKDSTGGQTCASDIGIDLLMCLWSNQVYTY